MTGKRDAPVFVERRTYRSRRMADAARLLPVFGAILICLPLLWTRQDSAPTLTTDAMYYFFGLWIVLVLVSLVISRHLRSGEETGTPPEDQ